MAIELEGKGDSARFHNPETLRTEVYSRITELIGDYFSNPAVSRAVTIAKLDDLAYSIIGGEILELFEQITEERKTMEVEHRYRQDRVDKAEDLLSKIFEKIENRKEFSDLTDEINDYLADCQ